MSPVLVLARNEGERLARNPAIWVSLALTAMWVRSARRVGQAEDRLFLLVGYGLLLPGFVMVVAVVLATLRSRLEHSDELLNTLAVGPDRRSIGHIGSTIFCGAIGLVATTATYLALSPARDLGAWDPGGTGIVTVPRPNAAQLVQGPAAVVAVAAFVIACVRWIPTWLVLLPLGFLLMVQGLFAGIFHGMSTDGVRWLYPLNTGVVNGEWKGCTPDEASDCTLAVSGFDAATPWWHLGYLSALVVWFTTISVLRDRRDRSAWLAFVAASVVVAACAMIQYTVADRFVVPS